MRRPSFVFGLVLAAAGAAFSPPRVQETFRRPEGFEFVKTVEVAGNVAWTDSGLDVKAGEEFYFEASGTVILQKDNPVAECGPDGLRLRTMQQPVPERNLGGLVGRVVVKVEVVEDKETKEKSSRDYGEVFFIGSAALAAMPADGRLTFGANENVVGDNDGVFTVVVFRRKA